MQSTITLPECWCYYWELPERGTLHTRRFTERKGAGTPPADLSHRSNYFQFEFPDLLVHVVVDPRIEEDYYALIEATLENDYAGGRLDRYKSAAAA